MNTVLQHNTVREFMSSYKEGGQNDGFILLLRYNEVIYGTLLDAAKFSQRRLNTIP